MENTKTVLKENILLLFTTIVNVNSTVENSVGPLKEKVVNQGRP